MDSGSSDHSSDHRTSGGLQAPDPFAMAATIKTQGPAPVHLWNPPFCGDIDMRISRDGSWFHEGKPIRREAMVKLFSSILKREGDRFFLVTPVEKVGIQVEDCPFVAVDFQLLDPGPQQRLQFVTNIGEQIILDAEHPLRVDVGEGGEPHPVIEVRSGLEALLTRALFYRLVEAAEERQREDVTTLGVRSAGELFLLGQA